MLHDHARRVREGFLWQAKQSGEQPGQPDSVMSDKDVDDMGNIVITGDINLRDGHEAEKMLRGLHGQQEPARQSAPQPTPQPAQQQFQPAPPQPTPPQPQSFGMKEAAMMTALALGSGGLGAYAYHYFQQPASDNQQQAIVNDGVRYDVEKWIPEAPLQ